MSTRLLGPRTKLERADEHFTQLQAVVEVFRAKYPYLFFPEDDAETGDLVYRVYVVKDPPPRFAAIVGDVVHNLRSALDLLAWQLVDAGGGTPGGNTMFPIARSKKGFESALETQVKGASDNAIRILEALKPYKGGNDGLWRLHRLDANDKHNLLVVLGMAQPFVTFSIAGDKHTMIFPAPGEVYEQPAIWDESMPRRFPLVDRDEIVRIHPVVREMPFDDEPKFTSDIALSDGEVVHGDPMIPVLNDLSRLVSEIIDLFEPLLTE